MRGGRLLRWQVGYLIDIGIVRSFGIVLQSHNDFPLSKSTINPLTTFILFIICCCLSRFHTTCVQLRALNNGYELEGVEEREQRYGSFDGV